MQGVSIAAAPAATASAPSGAETTTTQPSTGTGTTTPAPTTTTGVSLSPPAATTTAPGTTPTATDLLSAYPEHKALIESKGWKSPTDAFKAYSELETKFSSTRPADKPKAVTEYDAVIKPPADADKKGYSKDFGDFFKKAAFEAGVDVNSAGKFHDAMVSWAEQAKGTAAAKAQEAMQAAVDKAGAELVKAWGEPNTPQFARNVEMSRRAIQHLDPGLKAELVEMGAIVETADGQEMVAKPGILKALAKVGDQLYAEDRIFGNFNAANGNPFDPKTIDVTMQGKLVNEDPAKARQLIGALDPKDQGRYSYLLSKLNEKK
jgi:hypothetical protein